MFVFMNFSALNDIYFFHFLRIGSFARNRRCHTEMEFRSIVMQRKIIFMLTTGQQFAFINTLRLKDWS